VDSQEKITVSRRQVLVGVPAALMLTSVAAPTAAKAATAALPEFHEGGALSVRGADLSFTLQELAAGNHFSDHGRVRPVEEILARHGANWSRLRLWVDPPQGYSDLHTTIAMARRAKRAGLKVLLDLHYSDFWADPGHQTTPAAWAGQDLATLAETVRAYTRTTLRQFAEAGVPVDMVQVGNEITAGMLWPVGRLYTDDGAQHWTEFTTLLKAGIRGAREASTRRNPITVMVHIDRGGDNGGSTWFFDHVLAAGVEFDVIGESYYPFWHGSLDALQANLNDLAVRYGKDIVVVETAYPWTTGNGDDLANSFSDPSTLPDGDRFPPTPAGQAAYFEALRQVLLQVPNGRGAGFMDWEPEWIPGVGWEPGAGNPNDNLTMFDWSGEALPSLQAFRRP
jgi:arabinogalactan endo-1,4-beta-galactosidase